MTKLLLILLIFGGCASEPLTEQEAYERLARKEEMRDEIRALRNTCAARTGYVEIYQGNASASERRRMQRDVNFVPKHALINDFGCISSGELRRALGW
jgi:hypothetical protein